MSGNTRIATCNYCGTRALLRLAGKVRHELSCTSCGAPLHELRQLPVGDRRLHRDNPNLPPLRPHKRPADHRVPPHDPPPRPRKEKRRKSLGRWLIEEAWDAIEDIWD